jgi:hypothetical protein
MNVVRHRLINVWEFQPPQPILLARPSLLLRRIVRLQLALATSQIVTHVNFMVVVVRGCFVDFSDCVFHGAAHAFVVVFRVSDVSAVPIVG